MGLRFPGMHSHRDTYQDRIPLRQTLVRMRLSPFMKASEHMASQYFAPSPPFFSIYALAAREQPREQR